MKFIMHSTGRINFSSFHWPGTPCKHLVPRPVIKIFSTPHRYETTEKEPAMTEKTNHEEEIRRYQQSFLDREKALQMVIHRMSASLNLLTCVLKETTTEMLPITREKSHPYWVLVEACLSDMEETTETMERALTLILRKEQDQPFHKDRPFMNN